MKFKARGGGNGYLGYTGAYRVGKFVGIDIVKADTMQCINISFDDAKELGRALLHDVGDKAAANFDAPVPVTLTDEQVRNLASDRLTKVAQVCPMPDLEYAFAALAIQVKYSKDYNEFARALVGS